jgi:Dehydrogenase E1 component
MVAIRASFLLWNDSEAEDEDRMSDPGTTYRTREEVQRMRSTQDPIRGLQRYIEDWGVATEAELKASNGSLSLPSYLHFDRQTHHTGLR